MQIWWFLCRNGIVLIVSEYEVSLMEKAAPILIKDVSLGKSYVQNNQPESVALLMEEDLMEEEDKEEEHKEEESEEEKEQEMTYTLPPISNCKPFMHDFKSSKIDKMTFKRGSRIEKKNKEESEEESDVEEKVSEDKKSPGDALCYPQEAKKN